MNSQNLQNKLRDKFLKKGVKMKGPETVFFSKDTKIGKNVEIEPYVVFADKVKIGNNVKILSLRLRKAHGRYGHIIIIMDVTRCVASNTGTGSCTELLYTRYSCEPGR